MRDDGHRWDPPRALSVAAGALNVTEVLLPVAAYVSGVAVLARFRDRLVTWPDVVSSDSYALVLRRDRVLCVGDVGLATGYDAATGLAVTDVSDGFAVLDLSGPSALAALRRGAELRLDRPSRSVQRQVFGVTVMLYRIGAPDRFRVHVPRAYAQAFSCQLLDTT